MKRKILLNLMVMFLLIVSLVSFVGAEFWACFNYKEIINYCPYKEDETCSQKTGCMECMSYYHEGKYPNDLNCYVHGNNNKCIRLTQECSFLGSNTTIDSKPPELTINSPKQDSVYSSRSVLLDFVLDEEADVYYYDNINGRGRWTRVCRDCYRYSNKRSFDEGFNDMTFKAVDVIGNTAYVNRSFYVDSQKPRIVSIGPRDKFITTEFSVEYNENNLKEIRLKYGNLVLTKEAVLQNCPSGKRQSCSIELSLGEFEGQEIRYWFEITDIAGNKVVSKTLSAVVDETDPVLNNPDSFWSQGTGRYNKYIYFTLNITEKNFDEAGYIEVMNGREKYRRLCSRLKDGICETKKSFKKGHHILDVQITDKAGNAVGYRIDGFDVN